MKRTRRTRRQQRGETLGLMIESLDGIKSASVAKHWESSELRSTSESR